MRDYALRLSEEERLAHGLNDALSDCARFADDALRVELRALQRKTERLPAYFSELRSATEELCESAETISKNFADAALDAHERAVRENFLTP